MADRPKNKFSRKTWHLPVDIAEENKVIELARAGKNVHEIAVKTGVRHDCVYKIIQESRVKEKQQAIKQEILKDKVTILKDVIGQSLEVTKAYLDDLQDPEVRRQVVKTPGDMAQFALVATKLDQMLKLELGEATQNIAVVHYNLEATKKVLSELKEIDPIFEYPQLDEGPIRDTE